jgi:hypothetical protein
LGTLSAPLRTTRPYSASQKTKAVIGTLTEQYALRRYSEELDHRRREISGE